MAFPAEFVAEAKRKALEDPIYFRRVLLQMDMQECHRVWTQFSVANPFHVIEGSRGFGKTHSNTIGDAIEETCKDFNTRILIVSKTETQARRPLAAIRGYLETNVLLKACFGEFVGTGKWTDTELVIAQRTAPAPEATISAIGLEGPIVGGHWNHIFVDDPFDEESSRTPVMRDRAYDWLFTTLVPTLMPGGTMRIRCTRYHYEDLAGRIERELATDPADRAAQAVERIYRYEDVIAGRVQIPNDSRWKVLQTPAILSDGEEGERSLWEARFPLDDRYDPVTNRETKGLRRIRREMGTRRFDQQYQMRCPKESAGARNTIMKREWREGKILTACPNLDGARIGMHLDPAWKTKAEAAKVAKRQKEPDLFAIAVGAYFRANGDEPRRFIALESFADHLGPVAGIAKARELAEKWNVERCSIEKTGLLVEAAPDFYRTVRVAMPCPSEWAYPVSDKVTRSTPFQVASEVGEIYYLEGEGMPELFEEEDAFPYGPHDDRFDSVVGCYLLLTRGAPTRLFRYKDQKAPGSMVSRRGAVEGVPGTSRRGTMGNAPPGSSRRGMPGDGWR